MAALLLSERWQPRERRQSGAAAGRHRETAGRCWQDQHGRRPRELHNTAVELTGIMGHKNAAPFFSDPTAINPQTGQLLHPPLTLPAPPPDPKLLAVQFYAFDGKRYAIVDASPERPVTVKIPRDGKFTVSRP